MPTTLFRHASVITMNPGQPRAQAVLIQGHRIAWVGSDADVPLLQADRVIDCGGATLLPGLIDAHIHLLAYAASLEHLECGRDTTSSIPDLQRLIQRQARVTSLGQWVRARGYDEFYLRERRHPTRLDLDTAAPHHPVRLDHRSGHASVLNSRGLELVGIGLDTPDPAEGVIQRDEAGQPTGLLLEMGGYLSRRMKESRGSEHIASLLAEASSRLLQWGVTGVQDPSPENDLERWHILRGMREKGVLRQRLTFMPGVRHLGEFVGSGLACGAGDHWLRLGHAKLMVSLTTGALYPPEEEIEALVRDAHHNGFPVAAHAVEEEAILAVLRAFHASRSSQSGQQLTDRIEHCSEATPKVQMLLKAANATVVTQPGFIYESAERYAATVPQETQPWLYPLRTLRDTGILLAAGSDAPVASPDPWRGLYSAVTRRSADGLARHPEQGLPLEDALRLYTAGAADAAGQGGFQGTIRPGAWADLIVLDRDVDRTDPKELLNVRVALTLLNGDMVWQRQVRL